MEKKLAIELDGGQHYEPDNAAYDEARTAHLGELGIRVLRLTNVDVLRDPDAALEAIRLALLDNESE